MEMIWNDVKLAARRLLRERLFSVIAILTLAIGIGANSAIFTLVNSVLLRPLPYGDPNELVHVHAVIDGNDVGVVSSGAYLAIRAETKTLDGVAMVYGSGGTLTGVGEPELLTGRAVSSNYFDVIGVRPMEGRGFIEGENEPGAARVIILSESFWRERFGATSDIVGRTVNINDKPMEVVGVVSTAETFPADVQYWVPGEYSAEFRDPENVYALYMTLIGRLKPGATIEAAESDAVRVMELAKQKAGAVCITHDGFRGAPRTGCRIGAADGPAGRREPRARHCRRRCRTAARSMGFGRADGDRARGYAAHGKRRPRCNGRRVHVRCIAAGGHAVRPRTGTAGAPYRARRIAAAGRPRTGGTRERTHARSACTR